MIFDHSRADPACDTAYPGLETVFYEQVARLAQSPVEVQAGGQSLWLDGDALRETVWNGMYDQDKIRFLPLLIHQVAAGDYSTWSRMQVGAAEGSGIGRSGVTGDDVLCHVLLHRP